MVFQDISSEFNFKKHDSTASFLDRFSSFVLDYLIVSPLVLFLLYIFFQDSVVYVRSQPEAPESFWFYVLMSVMYVFLFSLAQSFFLYKYHATAGQYFLKIRVVCKNKVNPTFFQFFLRQILFWVSFLFLGLPLLSVMTNAERSVFYDNICGFKVVSLKENFENEFGFEKEFVFWRSFQNTLGVFVFILMGYFFYKSFGTIKSRSLSYSSFVSESEDCGEIALLPYELRLQYAIGLNLVNQLSDNCLNSEADFVLWKQKKSEYSLAYYAKSLTAENESDEKQYLEQACQIKSSLGCQISEAFLSGEIEKLYRELNARNFLSDVLKYELGLVLEKEEDLAENFKRLKEYGSIKAVKKYRLTEMISRETISREATGSTSSRAPASYEENVLENKLEQLELLEDL